MTLNLRLALLGLLSISATVSTDRVDAAATSSEPCACAGPCAGPAAPLQLPPAPTRNFDSFIIDAIIEDSANA